MNTPQSESAGPEDSPRSPDSDPSPGATPDWLVGSGEDVVPAKAAPPRPAAPPSLAKPEAGPSPAAPSRPAGQPPARPAAAAPVPAPPQARPTGPAQAKPPHAPGPGHSQPIAGPAQPPAAAPPGTSPPREQRRQVQQPELRLAPPGKAAAAAAAPAGPSTAGATPPRPPALPALRLVPPQAPKASAPPSAPEAPASDPVPRLDGLVGSEPHVLPVQRLESVGAADGIVPAPAPKPMRPLPPKPSPGAAGTPSEAESGTVAWTAAASSIPTVQPTARRAIPVRASVGREDDRADAPAPSPAPARPFSEAPAEAEPADRPPAAAPSGESPRPERAASPAARAVAGDWRLVLLGLVVVASVVGAGALLWRQSPGQRFTSIRQIRERAMEFDGKEVRLHGRVGQVFKVGNGHAFYLLDSRDTIVVYSRGSAPAERSTITLVGSVSTGFLDGVARPAVFESSR